MEYLRICTYVFVHVRAFNNSKLCLYSGVRILLKVTLDGKKSEPKLPASNVSNVEVGAYVRST